MVKTQAKQNGTHELMKEQRGGLSSEWATSQSNGNM